MSSNLVNRLSLLTAASFAALASAGNAQAQSSVTISGTLDVGIMRGYDKTSKVGGISRSNIAFSGNEDLGGGMAATFKLNSRFNVDTGAQEDSKSFFTGESTVGLKGSFGHVRLGRALTAPWQTDWNYDAWYNYDSIASPAWQMWHGNTSADPNVSSTGASFARLNNGIFYNSPSVGGVSVDLALGVEKQATDKNRSVSGALKYDGAGGPFSAMVGYEQNPVNNKYTFVAAKYKIGALAVMAGYDHETLANNTKNRSATLSAEYGFGQQAVRLGYGRQRDYKANFISAGFVHYLSKRTNVYASLGNQGKNMWGSTEAKTAFGVGVNHSF